MNYNIDEWKHVFKIDPAKEISESALTELCYSGTDAIMVGGTDNITFDAVLEMLSRVRRFPVPVVLEISELEAITPGYDYYFIPMVLNSKDKTWVMDKQHQAIKEYKTMMNWEETLMEGYCIMNEDAKAFQKTNCTFPLQEDVLAYAFMAEHIFHLPIFYIEYSGVFGNTQLVKQVSEELKQTKLFYGGGIATEAEARAMSAYADVIVVGNSIYTNFEEAMNTVQAIK